MTHPHIKWYSGWPKLTSERFRDATHGRSVLNWAHTALLSSEVRRGWLRVAALMRACEGLREVKVVFIEAQSCTHAHHLRTFLDGGSLLESHEKGSRTIFFCSAAGWVTLTTSVQVYCTIFRCYCFGFCGSLFQSYWFPRGWRFRCFFSRNTYGFLVRFFSGLESSCFGLSCHYSHFVILSIL